MSITAQDHIYRFGCFLCFISINMIICKYCTVLADVGGYNQCILVHYWRKHSHFISSIYMSLYGLTENVICIHYMHIEQFCSSSAAVKVFSHHCTITTLKTTSQLEDSSGKPTFSKAAATAVVWSRDNVTHEAQVTNDFYIFGLFNCYPFGRNVVSFTDFLVVSRTTLELCCTARTATLWAPLCLFSGPQCLLSGLCCSAVSGVV